MSCESNRGKFTAHMCAAGSAAAQTFGGPEAAEAALDTIFSTARAQATTNSAAQQKLAEAKTRALFTHMTKLGMRPPTHSASGLPKADAQFGYAAMYDTLNALRDGKPLPALAADIASALGQTRQLSALRVDEALARLRCGSCGRFAPSNGQHLCPNTTSPDRLSRALQRRLGVSASAYGSGPLADLITAARADCVVMRHAITGETVRASLDSLPLALTQGFVPQSWEKSATMVAVSGGRITPVMHVGSLTPMRLADDAVEAAAAASGAPIPAGTPIVSAGSALPTATPHRVAPAATPSVTGGSAYDRARFVGTEYRKKAARGTVIEADGHTYRIGDRSHDPDDWSTARKTGVYEAPPTTGAFSGIAVGRTLVEAAELVRTGSGSWRPDGVYELYGADGGLVALYDATTRTAGDMEGTPNASAAQMAAIILARTDEITNDHDRALLNDLDQRSSGRSTPLAAADGAYIAISADIAGNGPIMLGGAVAASKCPNCGKFMGAGGCRVCPRSGAAPAPTATEYANAMVDAPALATPVSAAPAESISIEPQITVHIEAPHVTVDAPTVQVAAPTVIVEAPQITVPLDADALAAGITARLPRPVTPDGTGGSALVVALPDERMITVLDRMLGRLEALERGTPVAAPTLPAAPTPPRPRRARSDRPLPAPATMTEQERIVAKLRTLRPDTTLPGVDPMLLPADFASLHEEIPAINPDFAINAQTRMIMQRIVNNMDAGQKLGRTNQTRSYAIYGPPGTGKNEIATQLAASMITVDAAGNERQGVHLQQVEFSKDMDAMELIGTTELEPDGKGGTRTVARLGQVGLAAAMGGVICLNEVVRNPKALTEFQPMLEEGVIRLKSASAGMITVPIHPSTVFIMTWNPGLEGDADRPAGAALARTPSYELGRPTATEQAARVKKFFSSAPKELNPHDAEVQAAVAFFNQVYSGITKGDIQQRGRGSKAVPGPRELNQFMLAGKTDGWMTALEQMRVYGDQNAEDKDRDWKFIQEQFTINFGADGKAVANRIAGGLSR